MLKAPNWLSRIEYEWQSPVWGSFLTEFARSNRLVRFDQRGNGLSDWDLETISPDAVLQDMEAVVAASGLDRFALFGISQGAAFSLRYAVEHPERVKCLVPFDGWLKGALMREDPEAVAPGATRHVQESFDEIQRMSTNTENALRIFEMNSHLDMAALARQPRVPTLILRNKGDRMVPIERGREIARLIPGATFVELPGSDRPIIQGRPYFDMFFEEVRAFLREHD